MALVGSAEVRITADVRGIATDIENQLRRAERGAQTVGNNIGSSMRRGINNGLGDPSTLMDGHLARFEAKGEEVGDRFGRGFLTGVGRHFQTLRDQFDFGAFGDQAGRETSDGFQNSLNIQNALNNQFNQMRNQANQAGRDAGREFSDGVNDGAGGREMDFDFANAAGRGGDRSGNAFRNAFSGALGGGGGGGGGPFAGLIVGLMQNAIQLNVIGGLITYVAGGISSLISSVVALGSSFAAATPALLSFGNVLGAVGQGAIVAGSLFKGIGQGISAYTGSLKQSTKASTQAAKSQLDEAERLMRIRAARLALTNAITDGARRNADALERASDAQEAYSDAIEGVSDAEEDVADAMRAEEEALRALNQARADAQERLEDLQISLDRASLNEERAALNLKEAEETLAEARAGGNTNAIYEADLAYREQLQTVKELTERNADLREEANKAQQEGIEGNQAVKDAQEDYKDSVEDSSDAQEGLRDAVERVSDAQRELARALEDIPRVAADVALQIAQAQLALKRALEQTAPAANAANAGLDKLNDAFQKLSPAAQNFVKFVVNRLGPAFLEIKKAGQEKFFPQLQEGLEGILDSAGAMDLLKDAVEGTADVLGRFAKNMLDAFRAPENLKNLRTIVEDNMTILDQLGDSAVNLVRPLGQIFAATSPLAVEWSKSVKKATDRFSEWINEQNKVPAGGGKSPLAQFFDDAAARLEKFWELTKNLGKGFGNIFKAALPAGDFFLDTMIKKSDAWRQRMEDQQEVMGEIFQGATENGIEFIGLAGDIGRVLFEMGANPAIGDITRAIRGIIPVLGEMAGQMLTQIAPGLIKIIESLPKFSAFFTQTNTIGVFMDIIGEAIDTLGDFFEYLSQFEGLAKVIGIVAGASAAFLTMSTVLGFLIGRVGAVIGVISKIGGVVGALGPVFGPLLIIIGAVAGLFVYLYKTNEDFRESVQGLLGQLAALGATIMSAIGPALRDIMGTLSQVLTSIMPIVTSVMEEFVGLLSTFITAFGPVLTDFISAVVTTISQVIQAIIPIVEAVLPIVLQIIALLTGLFMESITAIMPALTTIVQGIGDLFSVIGPQIATLFTSVGPALMDLFSTIATALVTLFSAIVPIFQQLMPPLMELITALSGAFLTAIQAIVPPLAQLISLFVDAFAGALVAILPAITQLITALVNGLVPLFQTLVPVIQSLVPPLVSIVQAISGALLAAITAILPVLLQLAQVFIDVFLTVLQAVLVPIAQLIAALVTGLAPIFAMIGPLVESLVPPFMAIIQAISGPLIAAITTLLPHIIVLVQLFAGAFVNALVAILPPIAQLITALVESLVPVFEALMPVIVALAEVLVGAFSDSIPIIMTPLMEFITVLVETLAPILMLLMPHLASLAEMFLQILAPAIEQLLPPILELVMSLVTMLLPILVELLPVFLEMAMTIANAFMPVIQELMPIILDLALMLINALLPVFQQLVPVIMQLAMSVLPLLLPVIQELLPVITELILMQVELFKAIVPLLPIIIDLVMFGLNVLTQALAFILPMIVKVTNGFMGVFIPIIRLVAGTIGWLVSIVTSVVKSILGLFRGLFESLQTVWDSTARPVLDWLEDAFQGVYDFIAGIVEGIKGVWNGIVDAIKGPVRTVVNGINDWLIRPLNKILGFFGLSEIAPIEVNWANSAQGGPVGDQSGGAIRGPGGPVSDVIPTMLSNGEYVVRARSAGKVGQRTLDHINRYGTLPGGIGGRGDDEFGIGGWGFLDSVKKLVKKGAANAIGVLIDSGIALIGPFKETKIGEFIVGALENMKASLGRWADGSQAVYEEAQRVLAEKKAAEEAADTAGRQGGSVPPYTGKPGGWTYPLQRNFQWRTYKGHKNPGSYDIGSPVGLKVYAVSAGRIYRSENRGNRSYGQVLMMIHKDGEKSLYGHLSKRIGLLNEIVRTGSVIGKSGNTGRSSGPHLHFELNQPRDAARELKRHGVKGINVRGMAAGGTIKATPGGIMALLAEGGRPERVTPLDNQGRSATEVEMLEVLKTMASQTRGGDTFQVFPAPGMNERELAVKVSREVAFQHRRRS
jgi:phage-related protein/murein DD-endopeptidase MepM/ murein hydrolase activator NlpD